MRKKLVPRTFAFTSRARISASPDWSGTITTAKMSVFSREYQKVDDSKSRVKLSSPMNRAGTGEISRALVNARLRVKMMGMIRKTIIRMPAGASMESATGAVFRVVGFPLRTIVCCCSAGLVAVETVTTTLLR